MKSLKMPASIMALALLVAVVGASCNRGSNADVKADGEKKITVAFIAMDAMDRHWLRVMAAARDKSSELGVSFIFMAPQGKSDPSEQVRFMDDAVNRKVGAILLAPTDANALNPSIDKAKAAGIKVIIIDSKPNTDNYDAFFGTNNAEAGALAADQLASLIGANGKVAIISGQAGAGSMVARETGFKDQIEAKYPGITVVTTQYSNGDRVMAMNQSGDIMTANADLVGLYATNEGSTAGTARGIAQSKKTGSVQEVGFDASEDTMQSIKDGVIAAVLMQNPDKMGSMGVQAAVDLINGKAIAQKDNDTGITVITKDNIDLMASALKK